MTASELTELAARVEAGSGADREINVLVWAFANNRTVLGKNDHPTGPKGWLCRSNNGYPDVCVKDGSEYGYLATPQYTTSLDAVVALIVERLPPSTYWVLHSDGECLMYTDETPEGASAGDSDAGNGIVRGLLAATLRALAAQQQDRQTEGE